MLKVSASLFFKGMRGNPPICFIEEGIHTNLLKKLLHYIICYCSVFKLHLPVLSLPNIHIFLNPKHCLRIEYSTVDLYLLNSMIFHTLTRITLFKRKMV